MGGSTVVIVDAAHLYEGIPDVLGMPKMDFDRRAILRELKTQLHRMRLAPWRFEWVDAALHQRAEEELGRLGLEDGVFVFLGDVIQGRQKGVDAFVQERLGKVASWRDTSQIALVAGDSDYVRPAWEVAVDKGIELTLIHVAGSGSATDLFKACFDRVRALQPETFRSCFFPYPERTPADFVPSQNWLSVVQHLGEIDAQSADAETINDWMSGPRRRIPAGPYETLGVRMSRLVPKDRFTSSEEKRLASAAWWRGVDSIVFGGHNQRKSA